MIRVSKIRITPYHDVSVDRVSQARIMAGDRDTCITGDTYLVLATADTPQKIEKMYHHVSHRITKVDVPGPDTTTALLYHSVSLVSHTRRDTIRYGVIQSDTKVQTK